MEIMLVIVVVIVAITFCIVFAGNEKKKSSQDKKGEYINYNLERARKYLQAAQNSKYRPKPLCNSLETAAYLTALNITLERRREERVFVEVSLGEILQTSGQRDTGYFAINSKRVDLLITDCNMRPLIVFEIDGSGHNTSEIGQINDKIKEIALSSAGIPLVRLAVPDDNQDTLRQQLKQHLYAFFAKKSGTASS
ncbi:MAG: DUF2726 domain-containing protein [Cardiobacteriaceae bacterium]|nr:DUF2726 domain-containing protein [Cardiobacteriaceae bacterium]